jgi:fructose-specific phosphotransferase system IIC component
MNCFYSGILVLSLLGGALLTMTVTEEQHNVLRNVLPDNLDIIYEQIIVERRNHYIFGLLLGAILAYIVLSVVKTSNRFHKISLFVAITLMTSVIFYLLMPKSDYMLNHMKTQEENKAWLSIYKTMKHRYLIGIILGALAAIPLGNAFC